MGLTDEEVREVAHVAMTVGASRMKVLADAELAKADPLPGAAPGAQTAPAAQPAPGFVAAGVEAGATGG